MQSFQIFIHSSGHSNFPLFCSSVFFCVFFFWLMVFCFMLYHYIWSLPSRVLYLHIAIFYIQYPITNHIFFSHFIPISFPVHSSFVHLTSSSCIDCMQSDIISTSKPEIYNPSLSSFPFHLSFLFRSPFVFFPLYHYLFPFLKSQNCIFMYIEETFLIFIVWYYIYLPFLIFNFSWYNLWYNLDFSKVEYLSSVILVPFVFGHGFP